MRNRPILAALAFVAHAQGASALEQGQPPVDEPTSPPVADWPKPMILPVMLPPSANSHDWTQLSIVWGKGLVGGTPEAVSSIGQPLPGRQAGSRALDACKRTMWTEAAKAGGESVEAATQGPDRRGPRGRYFAPVAMRLSYAQPSMTEVRKAVVICVVDRKGRFVDAYTPATQPPAKPSSARWSHR